MPVFLNRFIFGEPLSLTLWDSHMSFFIHFSLPFGISVRSGSVLSYHITTGPLERCWIDVSSCQIKHSICCDIFWPHTLKIQFHACMLETGDV